MVFARCGDARPADKRVLRVDAQSRFPPERVLRIFEVAEEVGEVHDSRGIRFGKLHPSCDSHQYVSAIGYRLSDFGLRTSDLGLRLRTSDLAPRTSGVGL